MMKKSRNEMAKLLVNPFYHIEQALDDYAHNTGYVANVIKQNNTLSFNVLNANGELVKTFVLKRKDIQVAKVARKKRLKLPVV